MLAPKACCGEKAGKTSRPYIVQAFRCRHQVAGSFWCLHLKACTMGAKAHGFAISLCLLLSLSPCTIYGARNPLSPIGLRGER